CRRTARAAGGDDRPLRPASRSGETAVRHRRAQAAGHGAGHPQARTGRRRWPTAVRRPARDRPDGRDPADPGAAEALPHGRPRQAAHHPGAAGLRHAAQGRARAAGGARADRRTGRTQAVSGRGHTEAAIRRPPAAVRRVVGYLAWLLAALLLAACSTPQPRAGTGEVAFVIVRHAEKAGGAGSDPALSDAGRERAAALARRLSGTSVAAVYTTDFRRTRDTVAPTAAAQGLAAIV